MAKNARSMAARAALQGPTEVAWGAVPEPRRSQQPLDAEALASLAEVRQSLADAVQAMRLAWMVVKSLEQQGYSEAQLREHLGPHADLAWALS